MQHEDDSAAFAAQCEREIWEQGHSKEVSDVSKEWLSVTNRYHYEHHFTWMGRPIIKSPGDIVAMQELIWQVKPDVVIECGIARGGGDILCIHDGAVGQRRQSHWSGHRHTKPQPCGY